MASSGEAKKNIIPTSFSRDLRACVHCRLVKTLAQFQADGCENCPHLHTDRVEEWSTLNFEGLMSLIDPRSSWVARWKKSSDLLPGCYAITVHGHSEEEENEEEGEADEGDDDDDGEGSEGAEGTEVGQGGGGGVAPGAPGDRSATAEEDLLF
eukprot:RCo027533